MIKYNLLVMVLILLVSCNAKKTIIQTSIKENNKANSVSKSATKTTANRSVIQSNRNANSQILEATSRVNVTNEIILKYIDTYKDVAQYNMKKYGIPASIILGQAILESGSGTGNLCVQANNHFGIKCHNDWIGESIKYDDDAKDECFRKYDKGADSFRDHSLFLTTRSRYAELFQLKATDYQSWANGLKNAGYATDVQYPKKLIGIIERFKLYQYDNLGLDVVNDVASKVINNTGTKYHIVLQGETLYSISKKYNVSIEDLKKQNTIVEHSISIGQTLVIQK